MKILITGASGQLGRCLLHPLRAHALVALDRYTLDVTQLERVRDAMEHHKPDLVINASAFNDVDGAESQVTEAYAVNALGPRNLATATTARGILWFTSRRILYSTEHQSAHTTNLIAPIRCRCMGRLNLPAKSPYEPAIPVITSFGRRGFIGNAAGISFFPCTAALSNPSCE
jgi:hypothetical protein